MKWSSNQHFYISGPGGSTSGSCFASRNSGSPTGSSHHPPGTVEPEQLFQRTVLVAGVLKRDGAFPILVLRARWFTDVVGVHALPLRLGWPRSAVGQRGRWHFEFTRLAT